MCVPTLPLVVATIAATTTACDTSRQVSTASRRKPATMPNGTSAKVTYHSISSGMYGHFLGKSLGMGYVSNKDGLADKDFIMNGRYEIEVAGVRHPAQASLQAFYDPRSERIRN